MKAKKTIMNSQPAKAIAYCADCDKEYKDVDESFIGQRFICEEDDKHTAVVIQNARVKIWLKIETTIFAYENQWTPRAWFQKWGGRLRGRPGWYGIICLAILFGCLTSAFLWNDETLLGISVVVLTSLVASYFIFDVLVTSTSIAFISRKPASSFRSAVLTIFSFFQIVVAFAVYYVALGCSYIEGPNPFNPIHALYFSFVTITTLGYGDIHPKFDSTILQLTVIVELIVGLYFLLIIISTVASWSNTPPYQNLAKKRLDELPAPPKVPLNNSNRGNE